MIRSELHGNVLPPLPKLPAKEMAGPTPWSNYVIRHADGHSGPMVLAGAYPASLDDVETERILTTLLEMGINTFVCLQAEVNINTPESAWRKGHGLRPYIKDAQRILSRAHEQGNPRIAQSKIDFLHLPIIDGSVTTDSAMSRLADDCCDRVLKGERLYIHCWGGHGRTGTLVAVMLGRLYSIPYTLALRYTQAFHDSRIYPQGVRSPQTPVQRAQVRKILTTMSPPPTNGLALGGPVAGGSNSRPSSSSTGASLLNKTATSGSLLGANGLRSSGVAGSSGSRIGSAMAPALPQRGRTPQGGTRYGSLSPLRGSSADMGSASQRASSAGLERLSADMGRLSTSSQPGSGSRPSTSNANGLYANGNGVVAGGSSLAGRSPVAPAPAAQGAGGSSLSSTLRRSEVNALR